MTGGLTPRPARPADLPGCAAIKNGWIDGTPWMRRIHPAADMERHLREDVAPRSDIWVVGEPVAGFAAVDGETDNLGDLFVARPGAGLGRVLLDAAKAGRDGLTAWVFAANTGARRFYAREGFVERRRTDGDNAEGLPDILLSWERSP